MSESDVERAQTEAENLPPCTCHDVMGGQVHEEGCIRGQAIRSRHAGPEKEAWRGTKPAEGTRRALIRDAIASAGGVNAGPGGPNAAALRLADTVESALLKATIDDEAAEIGSDPDRPLIPASEAMDELDRVGIPLFRDGKILNIGKRTVMLVDRYQTRLRELGQSQAAVERLEGICEERWQRIGELEDEVERLLTGREQARAGESRFAEERDAAFALLRWLLPVTVARRLDSIGEDD